MNKKKPLVNKHIRLGSEKLGSEKILPNAADKKNTCQQPYKTKAEMIIIYTLPNAVDKKNFRQ